MYVSNVDDHLRNHGFILMKDGWSLSPAYDINPCSDGDGLKLNISEHDNSQDLELALSVAEQFRLQHDKAKNIIFQVKSSVQKWQIFADEMNISKRGKEMMARAFRFSN